MSDDSLELERDALEKFIEEYMELEQQVQRPKGIFSVIGGPREGKYQNTLKYFLDPEQPHGFGYSLLEAFLELIGFREYNLQQDHIELQDEVIMTDDNSERRIDLVICGGSSLGDHPRWGVFMELKVGAEEGEDQTTAYAEADGWNFNWFQSDEIRVDDLENKRYIYLKKENRESAEDGTFEELAWADVVEKFENEVDGSFFEYPNRSIIQFTDFIQSLKRTEGMTTDFDEREINERLSLYFEYSDLIKKIEEANSKFESGFEELSTYLHDTWDTELRDVFDFEETNWTTSVSGKTKYQGILPEYWLQDPANGGSTIKLYFRHSPTTDLLRDNTLTFRLRLPPQRKIHKQAKVDGKSFNDIFLENSRTDYRADIDRALKEVYGVNTNFDTSSALIIKDYSLDTSNLAESYMDNLVKATEEFCGNEELLDAVNSVFEDTYQTVFDKPPEGDPPKHLRKKD